MTRMFDVHPVLICNKHTGSEWAELSQEAGLINRWGWNSTRGHANKFQVNVDNIPKRRKELQAERQRRGLKAENYTQIEDDKLKQADRVHGITIDSLTLEIMDNKSGKKDTMTVDQVEKCDCNSRDVVKNRLETIWTNL